MKSVSNKSSEKAAASARKYQAAAIGNESESINQRKSESMTASIKWRHHRGENHESGIEISMKRQKRSSISISVISSMKTYQWRNNGSRKAKTSKNSSACSNNGE